MQYRLIKIKQIVIYNAEKHFTKSYLSADYERISRIVLNELNRELFK